MTWFKVDDGLHSHRKAVRAGVAAMGLWVLSGSWASDQLSDGWIPRYIAARLDPKQYERHAAALVQAGLWIADEHEGESGWWFHQWEDHQPTAKTVHERRDAAKDRMRRAREQRRIGSSEVRAQFDERSREHVENAQRTSRGVRITPTRPDPTRSSYGTTKNTLPDENRVGLALVPDLPNDLDEGSKVHVATTDEAETSPKAVAVAKPRDYETNPDFLRFWAAYPRKTGKPSAWTAWKKALARGHDVELIIRAAAAYRDDPQRNDRFTKHPGPWLNDERYNDQPAQPLAYAAGAFWDN